jgi:hypothetical protein
MEHQMPFSILTFPGLHSGENGNRASRLGPACGPHCIGRTQARSELPLSSLAGFKATVELGEKEKVAETIKIR